MSHKRDFSELVTCWEIMFYIYFFTFISYMDITICLPNQSRTFLLKETTYSSSTVNSQLFSDFNLRYLFRTFSNVWYVDAENLLSTVCDKECFAFGTSLVNWTFSVRDGTFQMVPMNYRDIWSFTSPYLDLCSWEQAHSHFKWSNSFLVYNVNTLY